MATTTAKTAAPTSRSRKRRTTRPVPHLTVAERVARGKAARAEVPRSSHAVLEPAGTRVDPVELLEPRTGHCAAGRSPARTLSGDRIAIAAYLGAGDRFDRAILDFSKAYAEQNERDYQALLSAVNSGRIAAQTGL